VREDGKEDDVFALIGPKRYDVPWKVLENQGFIAEANCFEFRVKFDAKLEKNYVYSDKRNRYRIAAENPKKINLVRELLNRHKQDQVLIIGQYITQLEAVASQLKLPIIIWHLSQPMITENLSNSIMLRGYNQNISHQIVRFIFPRYRDYILLT
jgi:DNA excision repair protein ERCC-3